MSATARWGALDAGRGLAVVAMILFHAIWDLGHFGYIASSIPWSAPVKAFGHSIALSFLFIAGLSLALAHGREVRWRAFWRRLGIVAGAAALVSAGTYIVFPSAFVFFGILHCIAAASLIAAPFLLAPWPLAAAAAMFFFAGPHLFASPFFNPDRLQWVGLGTSEPYTMDWRPLFPWAGALLLGLAAGRALPLPLGGAPPEPDRGARHWLSRLGRHSLLIYLAHQPLLFAVFAALVFVAPPADGAKSFLAACEKGCVRDGGAKDYCRAACVCTLQETVRTRALEGVSDPAQRARILDEMAARCAGRE